MMQVEATSPLQDWTFARNSRRRAVIDLTLSDMTPTGKAAFLTLFAISVVALRLVRASSARARAPGTATLIRVASTLRPCSRYDSAYLRTYAGDFFTCLLQKTVARVNCRNVMSYGRWRKNVGCVTCGSDLFNWTARGHSWIGRLLTARRSLRVSNIRGTGLSRPLH